MRDRRGQFDVTHAHTTHFGARHFNAATVANDTFELRLFELAARAFQIFSWTKDALAKQAVAFGLESAVVDSFGFLDFAPAPRTDVLRAGDTDAKQIERGRRQRLLYLFATTHFAAWRGLHSRCFHGRNRQKLCLICHRDFSSLRDALYKTSHNA